MRQGHGPRHKARMLGRAPPATEHGAQSVETPVHVVVWHQPVISRLHRTNREEPKVGAVNMGQSMVAIEASDCTGCDLCIPFCPFEALLPLASTPPNVRRRPVIVLDDACVGCLRFASVHVPPGRSQRSSFHLYRRHPRSSIPGLSLPQCVSIVGALMGHAGLDHRLITFICCYIRSTPSALEV